MFCPRNCMKGTRFGSAFNIMVRDVNAAWYLWALCHVLQSWNPGWTWNSSSCGELMGAWPPGVCHSLPSSLADRLSEGRVLRDLVGHGAGWADNPAGPHRFQKHSLRVSVHTWQQQPLSPTAPCVCTGFSSDDALDPLECLWVPVYVENIDTEILETLKMATLMLLYVCS